MMASYVPGKIGHFDNAKRALDLELTVQYCQ